MNEDAILKIQNVFKMGYLPSRGKAPYYFSPITLNCFGHACFNLTDEILRTEQISNDLFEYRIPSIYSTEQHVSGELFERIASVGLKVSPCNIKEKLNFNEWKVALYFSRTPDGIDDYHFLLQEKNGKWSCKFGWHRAKISYFKKLPEIIAPNYVFYGTYKITNPHIKIVEKHHKEK